MGHQPLPERITLPIFVSGTLSSIAYTPDETLLIFTLVGFLTVMWPLWVGVFVALVLAVVIVSYHQTVRTYPSGGGDYEVVAKNLGRNWDLFVASTLLMDCILTVATPISSDVTYIATALPALHGCKLTIAVNPVVLLALVDLREMKDAGGAFAIPTYICICPILLAILIGLIEFFTGTLGQAPTAQYELTATPDHAEGPIGLGRVSLLMWVLSSGCAALTGIEATSNGIPMFRRPKSKSAATTLAVLGAVTMTVMLPILLLARATGVKIVENSVLQLTLNGVAVDAKTHIQPVIGQLAVTVFSSRSILFLLIAAVTGLVLVLTANTAPNGPPTLVFMLSRDSFLSRQLYKRGDRLFYSSGILALALVTIILIVASEAEATRFIELHAIGIFISFTLSQFDMIRHWNRQLCMRQNGSERGRALRSRAVSVIGFVMTSLVLLTALMTKLTHGAWITLIVVALTFLVQLGIRRYYDTIHRQLHVEDWSEKCALPTRVRALAFMSSLLEASMRAIATAHSPHPSILELVSVVANEEEEQRTRKDREQSVIPLPLILLSSPYRDLTHVVLQYIRELHHQSPREILVVYMLQVLVHHWWENAICNQTQERPRHTLLTVSGVILTIVP